MILAKHYGARVIAVASSNKHETVRALGADHIADLESHATIGKLALLP